MDFYAKFTEGVQRALARAQQEAKDMGHNYVGTEHVLLGLMSVKDGAAAAALRAMNITEESVRKRIIELTGKGEYKFDNTFDYTPRTKKVIELSLNEAKRLKHNYVGTEHMLLALSRERDGVAARILMDLGLDLNQLIENMTAAATSNKGKREKTGGPTPTLDQFSRDLTREARDGELDPVIGREKETERIIQILCRRTKNNPVLIGEPGVGKSVIADGLAQRIVENRIPDLLKNKRVVSLDVAGMLAGTKYRGEFEERIKTAMEELKTAGNVILFIDEMHVLIGAGAAEGAIDASNILKPALARGEIQVVGATTLDEYRKHIEKDAALERRFQPVMVGEPTKDEAVEILKGLRDRYEAHHKLKISDAAIKAAVDLSDRYITDRFLPDKAIDLMDEAASAVRIAHKAEPPDVHELEKELARVQKEKEEAVANQNFEKAAAMRDEEKRINGEIEKVRAEWNSGESGLVVGEEDIARVVSGWTGIPVSRLTEDESQRLLRLEEELHKRVIGQDEAVQTVARAIRRARSGLKDPKRPIGSFMFLGPTGVGKTELSKALAEVLFGKDDAMIRIDMSEYMEKHSVSRLVGSPPGYIGHDEGGQLTESIRRKPYSVILFDEVEKAHPDVFNVLLQVMDDGRLTDSKGRTVNFRNAVLIMTSNVGARELTQQRVMGFGAAPESAPTYERMKSVMLDELKKTFRPEFLNRLDDIVVFHSLKREDIRSIVDLMIDGLAKRMKERGITLSVTEELRDYLAKEGFDEKYGARPLRRAIQQKVEDGLSDEILQNKIHIGDSVEAYMDGETLAFRKLNAKPVAEEANV